MNETLNLDHIASEINHQVWQDEHRRVLELEAEIAGQQARLCRIHTLAKFACKVPFYDRSKYLHQIAHLANAE